MSKTRSVAAFNLSGKFLGYVFKDGYKIKQLKLATDQGEYSIKMTKAARASLQYTLLPGDWIQVMGEQKLDRDTHTLKLKAYWIRQSSDAPAIFTQSDVSAQPKLSPSKTNEKSQKSTILFCEKSTCMKRGGKAVCKALENALSERGLSDEVKLKGTGCMKACGKGPNVVFMPGKVRYTKISAKDIPALVDEHFAIVPATSEPQPAPYVASTSKIEEFVPLATVEEQPLMARAQ